MGKSVIEYVMCCITGWGAITLFTTTKLTSLYAPIIEMLDKLPK